MPSGSLITPGYWCECTTQSPATGDTPALLDAVATTTPAQAVRWIKAALWPLASSIDWATYQEAWSWLTTDHRASQTALEHGQPCSFTLHQADTRIRWTARPVLLLTQTPHPADEFSAHAEPDSVPMTL